MATNIETYSLNMSNLLKYKTMTVKHFALFWIKSCIDLQFVVMPLESDTIAMQVAQDIDLDPQKFLLYSCGKLQHLTCGTWYLVIYSPGL